MQGNAATSLFDVNQFLETSHAGKLDTRYVLPDMGDYPAQTTDKITSRSGVIADGDYAGNAWANVELQWELQSDEVRKKLNMEHVYVRQSLMLDLDQDSWKKNKVIQLDFGINRNMRLKRLLDATGLNSLKAWSITMLKHQPALVHVTHKKIENYDDPIAEVDRVSPLSQAR
jgi:hypothetical protein